MNLREASRATVGTVSPDSVAEAVDLIETSDIVCCTGVGKSGDMAHLAASLLQSVGIRAAFVHTTDLLHGGLTMLRASSKPAIVALSHSGATREVTDVLELSGRYVLITGGSHIRSDPGATQVVCRYVCPAEGGVHGTIPSASLHGQLAYITEIACLIGDGRTTRELAAGHPGGALGRFYATLTERSRT